MINNIENQHIVIFGASGDLTFRKIVPALFDLYSQSMFPGNFVILGVSRSELKDADFRNKMKEGIEKNANLYKNNVSKLDSFLSHLFYLSINTSNAEDYINLKARLSKLSKEYSILPNYLFYLAVPPSMYFTISDNLYKSGLLEGNDDELWKRIIIEKPFGYDLSSAMELNNKLLNIFKENQIFRIDHYLGKETVQNILVFRFSNGMFEPLWNRNYIDYVEITAAEVQGITNRGQYYDSAGAIRDMLQNHLLHLVALIAMEPPVLFESDSLRNEIIKVFQGLHPLDEEFMSKNVIRGQYLGGKTNIGNMKAYREEANVDPQSNTETFVAMKLYIDNWRWGGVPFYIRTGKRLPANVTEIVITMKKTPHIIFKSKCKSSHPNKIIIRIQPEEAISIQFGLKTPGRGYDVRQVQMNFKYSDIANSYIPSAYERLLLDAMQGDASLFIRSDSVEATWRFLDPLLNVIQTNPTFNLYSYLPCTWGPSEANNLIPVGWHRYENYCKVDDNDDQPLPFTIST